MSKKLATRNDLENSHSPLDFKIVCGQCESESAYAAKLCDVIIPTVQSPPVGYSNITCNLNFKEDPWLTETKRRIQRIERECMKKGAVDGTQRQNDDKRRMWRRQLPGDGYVWETDTSPGM